MYLRSLVPMVCCVIFFFRCNEPNQGYQLKEISGAASCVTYQILTAENQPVDLPKSIFESLNCPSMIDLTEGVLTYMEGHTVKLYRIKDKINSKMFTLHQGMDGVSKPVWSEDGKRIMFVVINQRKTHGYTDFARIISLDLGQNMQVKTKHKFDRPVNFTCGSVCNSEADEDFKYVDKGIEYKRNLNIEDRAGEFEFILLDKNN